MNIIELYAKTPVDRHQEIVVSGGRLFFDGEEYVIGGDGELKLIRSSKGLAQSLEQILVKMGIKIG